MWCDAVDALTHNEFGRQSMPLLPMQGNQLLVYNLWIRSSIPSSVFVRMMQTMNRLNGKINMPSMRTPFSFSFVSDGIAQIPKSKSNYWKSHVQWIISTQKIAIFIEFRCRFARFAYRVSSHRSATAFFIFFSAFPVSKFEANVIPLCECVATVNIRLRSMGWVCMSLYDINMKGLWNLMEWSWNAATRARNRNASILTFFGVRHSRGCVDGNECWTHHQWTCCEWVHRVRAHRQHVDRSLARTLCYCFFVSF